MEAKQKFVSSTYCYNKQSFSQIFHKCTRIRSVVGHSISQILYKSKRSIFNSKDFTSSCWKTCNCRTGRHTVSKLPRVLVRLREGERERGPSNVPRSWKSATRFHCVFMQNRLFSPSWMTPDGRSNEQRNFDECAQPASIRCLQSGTVFEYLSHPY